MQQLQFLTSLTAMECKQGTTVASVWRHPRTLVLPVTWSLS